MCHIQHKSILLKYYRQLSSLRFSTLLEEDNTCWCHQQQGNVEGSLVQHQGRWQRDQQVEDTGDIEGTQDIEGTVGTAAFHMVFQYMGRDIVAVL